MDTRSRHHSLFALLMRVNKLVLLVDPLNWPHPFHFYVAYGYEVHT